MAQRTSQQVVEAQYTGSAAQRTSQQVVEAQYTGTPAVRMSQLVLEVAYVEGGAPPSVGIRRQVIWIG